MQIRFWTVLCFSLGAMAPAFAADPWYVIDGSQCVTLKAKWPSIPAAEPKPSQVKEAKEFKTMSTYKYSNAQGKANGYYARATTGSTTYFFAEGLTRCQEFMKNTDAVTFYPTAP
jgi:hypothetical protein